MLSEAYPCYIRVCESPENPNVIELPTQDDGTILLTTITAQHADVIGLRFKSASGAWRGVPVTEGALRPPLEGWGSTDYFVTLSKKAEKRKIFEPDGPGSGTKREKDMLSDLIVLGLPYSTSEEEFLEYFEKFGDVVHSEIKYDTRGDTKRSRGFGFVRFNDAAVAEEVLEATHELGGRTLEVKIPNKPGGDGDFPTKLFIGRLPDGTSADDLRECFSEYAPFVDVYVPQNFRNFGFITFASQTVAQEVLGSEHTIDGHTLNVKWPTPKHSDMNNNNNNNNFGPLMVGRRGMPLHHHITQEMGGGIVNFAGYAGKQPVGYYTPTYYQTSNHHGRR